MNIVAFLRVFSIQVKNMGLWGVPLAPGRFDPFTTPAILVFVLSKSVKIYSSYRGDKFGIQGTAYRVQINNDPPWNRLKRVLGPLKRVKNGFGETFFLTEINTYLSVFSYSWKRKSEMEKFVIVCSGMLHYGIFSFSLVYLFLDSLMLLLRCGYLISALVCRHSDRGSCHHWDPFFAEIVPSDRSTYFSVCLLHGRLLEQWSILPFWRGSLAVGFEHGNTIASDFHCALQWWAFERTSCLGCICS